MTTVRYKRMIKHLPTYERNNTLINEIVKSIAVTLDEVKISNEKSYAELFIDTAERALTLHERDLNIPKDILSLQQRRELIMASYRATLDQTTEETIKSVASAFSNGEVEITETDVEGVYEIEFVGTIGIPDNMQGLMNTIDIIIPAHLDVIYMYTFNTHLDLSRFTHAQLANYTHKQLREDVIS